VTCTIEVGVLSVTFAEAITVLVEEAGKGTTVSVLVLVAAAISLCGA